MMNDMTYIVGSDQGVCRDELGNIVVSACVQYRCTYNISRLTGFKDAPIVCHASLISLILIVALHNAGMMRISCCNIYGALYVHIVPEQYHAMLICFISVAKRFVSNQVTMFS